MNKRNAKQRKSIGKESPLSKRPKLDFTMRPKDSLEDSRDSCKESPNGRDGKINDCLPNASDWDDDFSGDMLEKVCLIADLSQAMVSNQAIPEEVDRGRPEIIEVNIPPPGAKPRIPSFNFETGELEKLRVEYEKLQEKLKTKEGEVHILRSQLKQNEDSKQTIVMQNIKVVEEIQKRYNEKISLTEKELESTKTKLQFKDMEYKTLSERCRQLEFNLNKSKQGEVNADNSRVFPGLSQTVTQLKEIDVDKTKTENDSKLAPKFNFCLPARHEGKFLAKLICPEFFKLGEEPSVVPLYTFRSGIDCHKLNFDKKEKYRWSGLPQQKIFVKDLYNSVTSLITHESFSHRDIKESLQKLLESCYEILTHNKDVILFLEELQSQSTEHDDSDERLLENVEFVKLVTVKDLLDSSKLNEEECGLEGRRVLGLTFSLIKSSSIAFDCLKDNLDFFRLLRDIAAGVGNLRRPLRYTGTLVGVALVLQRMLQEKNLKKEVIALINEILEEIIFARPKLDVLREAVNVLASGKLHLDFLTAFCRKPPMESRSLYRDSKLKQAMLFTKDACPLLLLCLQIMGLAGLPSSQGIRWDVTDCFIKWLNNSITTPDYSAIKWLPVNAQEDRCFNVTECLLYLLNLCLRDYNSSFPPQKAETEFDQRKNDLISIIGHGAVLLKRILKANQKQLHDNTYFLRFATLLKALMPSKSDLCHKNHMSHMSSVQMEAISWIIDSLESGLRNQDCCLKQNTSVLSDADIFSALKIYDDVN